MKTPSFRNRFQKTQQEPNSFSPRVVAEISAANLIQNYLAIRKQVPGKSLLPMVKANGYGHGAVWAAKTLVGQPDLAGFGVATLEEGKELREGIGLKWRKTRIVIFSGASDWSDAKGEFCEQYHLTPILSSEEDWRRFFKGGWHLRIPYELKFNTGFNRLGISPSFVRSLIRQLSSAPVEARPAGVLSHLAIGEDPRSSLSLKQQQAFLAIHSELASSWPATQFHLANSSAIWTSSQWKAHSVCDLVRPGLSLYGIPPWRGAAPRNIAPVLTLKASVIDVHSLKAGEFVGYGGAFQVKKEPIQVAVLAAGYADGVLRSLSGVGHDPGGGYAWLKGRETRFIGRVSMDMSCVRCGSDTRVGDWAEIFGPHIDPWAQAISAGTIPYELLTSISSRVQRKYV